MTAPSELPAFSTRMAKEIITGLVRRGGKINEGACGVVTDEKHKDFGHTVYNVWFPVNPAYPSYDDHANFRVSESKDGFVSLEGSFRLQGTNGDGQVTRTFTLPSERSRQGRYAWVGVETFLALFRRIGRTCDTHIITQDTLERALTLLWWGANQSMKAVDWKPGDFEPLRKAWAEVAPLWPPPSSEDEVPDYVRNTLDIPWPEEEPMPRTSRPRSSAINDTVKTERNIIVTLSQSDMETALIEWAKRNLGFNPPEGAKVHVEIFEEGNDDNGNHGEPAFATLTVKTIS